MKYFIAHFSWNPIHQVRNEMKKKIVLNFQSGNLKHHIYIYILKLNYNLIIIFWQGKTQFIIRKWFNGTSNKKMHLVLLSNKILKNSSSKRILHLQSKYPLKYLPFNGKKFGLKINFINVNNDFLLHQIVAIQIHLLINYLFYQLIIQFNKQKIILKERCNQRKTHSLIKELIHQNKVVMMTFK